MPPDTQKITGLFLDSIVTSSEAQRFDSAVRDLDQELARLKYQDRFTFQVIQSMTIFELSQVLHEHGDAPLILHFVVRYDEGGIYIDGIYQEKVRVEIQALRDFLAHFHNVRCVILYACPSEELAETFVEVVPSVICIPSDVTDMATMQFTTAFYDAVGAGCDFKTAFKLADSSIALDGYQDAMHPMFKSRETALVNQSGDQAYRSSGAQEVTATSLDQARPGRESQRHTEIHFPRQCQLNALAKLVIRLTLVASSSESEDLRGPERLDLHPDPDEQLEGFLDLVITVASQGFTVNPSWQPLRVPLERDSDFVEFELIGSALGEQVVEIRFYHRAVRVGYVVIKSEVLPTQQMGDRQPGEANR